MNLKPSGQGKNKSVMQLEIICKDLWGLVESLLQSLSYQRIERKEKENKHTHTQPPKEEEEIKKTHTKKKNPKKQKNRIKNCKDDDNDPN